MGTPTIMAFVSISTCVIGDDSQVWQEHQEREEKQHVAESKETTQKTHPLANPAESRHKTSGPTVSPRQQPAWTQAMGNHPPVSLQLKRVVSQPDGRSEEEAEGVAEQVVSRKSSGRPLPAAVQRQMETAFGQDFSHVRIHEGTQAASIGAIAYTRGTDIHFAPGAYQPESTEGQALLGHELVIGLNVRTQILG